MSSKAELYKLLLDTSPYGTLFFVYGVCVDCNPRAQQILCCDKRSILGTSLDDTELNEPVVLASLKQQVNNAIEDAISHVDWQLKIGDIEEKIALHVQRLGDEGKEVIVTLLSEQKSLAGPAVSSADNEGNFGPHVGRHKRIKPKGLAADYALSTDIAAQYPIPDVASVKNPRSANKATPKRASESQANIERKKAPAGKDKPGIDVNSILSKLSAKNNEARRRDSDGDRDVYFDSLTELPNRQLLIATIRQHFEDSEQGSICAALMLIDLDHFKDINDSWGHDIGDQVLVKVARAIEPEISNTCMAARMSGDEFMLFLPDAGANPGEGAVKANKIAASVIEAIAKPIFYNGNEFILTASVGIALLTDHKTSPERAIQYADTAMYQAKRQGRNGVAFFDQSISDKAQKQIGMNTRLRKAVENQEFALYIQPQISILDGRLVGGEALLRWVNSDLVTGMPSEFIPLLESSGLIVDVGHWVIRTACEYIRNFIDEGLWQDHMRLGINISPRQFNDPQLLEVIKHSLHSYNIEPKYLNFEVTENLLIEDIEDVIKKMTAIKELGAKFSIDDFGVGYSSMIYLKRLPFDWLKIDREFIRNIQNDADSLGVVEAILAVSKQYGLSVTAEGIEDLESLKILRKAGCDIYQGAYFSMPVPVLQFREYLAA